MPTVAIQEAQARLAEIIAGLLPGEEVQIVEGDRVVARLIGVNPVRKRRKAGTAKGQITVISDDDDHLDDFAAYMQ